ncbi:hypothetical protein [Methylocystis echinoides]|uniref:hypothetical protein n=1 Tax=Methylocystis echinoides TaxID=29468 RepID=UPI0034197510
MLTEHDHAIVPLGAAPAMSAAAIPEIRLSAADAPKGGARVEEATAGASNEPQSHFAAKAGRAGRALAAYALAGLIGWHLYDIAAPIDWRDVLSFGSSQKAAEQAEMLRVTQKMAADIASLQARLDAIEKAHGAEAKNAASVDAANRRLDDVKAQLDAELGALAGQIKEVQREAEAKRQATRDEKAEETRPASEPADRRAAGRGDNAHRSPYVAAHVEAGWKHGRRRGDAFDPALHPTAPGAPRPLGAPLYRQR